MSTTTTRYWLPKSRLVFVYTHGVTRKPSIIDWN